MRETPLTVRNDVGLFLLGARLRAGLTEEQVADRTGLTVDTVKELEDHATAVDRTVAEFIAVATASGIRLVGRQAEGDEELPDESMSPPPITLPPWQPGERRAIYMNDISLFPHALRIARIKTVMSIHQAHLVTGINEVTISKHETGVATPNVDRLSRYATAYNVEFVIGPSPAESSDG